MVLSWAEAWKPAGFVRPSQSTGQLSNAPQRTIETNGRQQQAPPNSANGPLGIGKSTLALMYSRRHRLALNLDIDLIRSNLGQWREQREESAKLAWQMARRMGEVVLAAGNDVVVAQATRRLERFDYLEQLASATGAELHEILLLVPKRESVRRFIERGQADGFKLGYRPGGLIDCSGGIAGVEATYDQVVAAAESRSRTVIIRPAYGSPEATYQEILAAITGAGG